MKKVLLLAILITSSLFAQAQKGKKSPEERAQSRVEKISQELNLSDTQEQEIYELFLSEGKKGLVEGKNIRDLNKDERQAYINARKEEKAAIYEKIAEILDEDQFATFQTLDKSRKPVKASSKGKGKKASANRVEQRVERLTEELSLTPEQQTQVKDLFLAQEATQKGKRAQGKELTKEERTANKEAWKAAKAANEEGLKAILTSDQLATYEANKGSRGEKGKGHAKGKGMKHKGNFVENRVQSLTEKLQLSETQQDQVASILTKHHEARIAKRGNQELTDEAKEARKADRKNTKAQLDAEMKAVLSAEQYATYQKEDQGRGKGKGKKMKGKKKGKKSKIEE